MLDNFDARELSQTDDKVHESLFPKDLTGWFMPRYDRRRPNAHRLERVLSHIDENLDVELPLEKLADVARLSVFQFSRVFKETVGLPPHAFIIQRRVRRASWLLLTSSLPICEVAYAVGFSSQSHMTTTVKRLTGQTPGQIRRSVMHAAASPS